MAALHAIHDRGGEFFTGIFRNPVGFMVFFGHGANLELDCSNAGLIGIVEFCDFN